MVGRTNAGISGGSSSTWYAYIQVSTDANAVITAVNPAGNSYTKTADSTGSAIFIVSYPGTYTISETDAPSQTVVVADYGVAYSVSIHVPPPVGTYLILNGNPQVTFSRAAAIPLSYASLINQDQPFISTGVSRTNPVTGSTESTVLVNQDNASSGGCYFASNVVDLTRYSKLCINMWYGQNYANLYFGVFSSVSGGWINSVSDTQANYQTTSISTVLNIALSASYYIGVYVINDSSHSNTNAFIRDLYLA